MFWLKWTLFKATVFKLPVVEMCCLHCDSVTVLTEFEFTEFKISQDHEALQTKCANLLWNVALSHLKSLYLCWRHNKENFYFQTHWRYFKYSSCKGSHLSSLHSDINFVNEHFYISPRHWRFSSLTFFTQGINEIKEIKQAGFFHNFLIYETGKL